MSREKRALLDVPYDELAEMPALTLYTAVESDEIDISGYDLSGDPEYGRKKSLLHEKLSLGSIAHAELVRDMLYRKDGAGASSALDEAARRKHREARIDNEAEALDVRAEAKTRQMKKQGESEFAEQRAGWTPVVMSSLLKSPPLGADPLVWWDLPGGSQYVLATRASNNRIAGGPKSGKSRASGAYIYARITGEPMMGVYSVAKAEEGSVFVVLDAEQSSSDAYVEFNAYLRDLPPEDQDRVVLVRLQGMATNVLNATVREQIEVMVRETMVAQGLMERVDGAMPVVADLVIDPLAGFLPAGINTDTVVSIATAYYNEVLAAWGQSRLGAENTWTVAHTSDAAGKSGNDVKIYGSIFWDSKFEALWYLTRKGLNDDGARLFGAQPGRGDTGCPPVHVALDERGRAVADPTTMDDALREHRGVPESRSGAVTAEQKNETTDAMVEAYLTGQNAIGKKPTTNSVYRYLKGEADAAAADGKDPKALPYFFSKTGTQNALARLKKIGRVDSGATGSADAWEVVSDAD